MEVHALPILKTKAIWMIEGRVGKRIPLAFSYDDWESLEAGTVEPVADRPESPVTSDRRYRALLVTF